jgi:hypothetical protein
MNCLSGAHFTTSETPSNSPDDIVAVNKSKTVQFGTPSAVEYETDGFTKELTPMPPEVAKERFPLKVPEVDEERRERAAARRESRRLRRESKRIEQQKKWEGWEREKN